MRLVHNTGRTKTMFKMISNYWLYPEAIKRCSQLSQVNKSRKRVMRQFVMICGLDSHFIFLKRYTTFRRSVILYINENNEIDRLRNILWDKNS